MSYEIRDALPTDVPGILDIYNDAVLNTTAIWNENPGDLGNRQAWFEARAQQGYPILVATDETGVLGYASFGDWRPFEGFRLTVEHSVYVRGDQRGKGLGPVLMAALIEENDQSFKLQLNRYKYAERYPEQPMEHYRSEGEVFLRKLDGLLQRQDFLLAAHPSLADMALLPFIRQFAHVDRDWFAQTPYRHLQAWLEGLLQSGLFVAVMVKQQEQLL